MSKTIFVSVPKQIHFVKYCSAYKPRSEYLPENLLPPGDWYAVPGGYVIERKRLELWGLNNKIKVSFQE